MDGNLNVYHTNVSARHNTISTIANVTADMLSMVCRDVMKEPGLSTTPDSNDELRADISGHSFWQRFQKAFVDVRVFYPFAPSYRNRSLATTIKKMENQKKENTTNKSYMVKMALSLPLCFQPVAGWARKQSNFIHNSTVMSKIRCQLELY